MKKLVCLSFLALAACGGNDDAPTPVQTPPQTNGSIYGKWYYKDTVVAGNVFPYDDHEPCGKDYIEFYDVNMVRSVDVWDCVEEVDFVSTFVKNGNQLTIGNESENPTAEIVELSATMLSLQYSDDVDGNGTMETVVERFDR